MKYLIAIIAFVLLISSAYAFEFDNKKYYDSETRIVTFKDSFLGLPTTEIAKAKLETPQVYQVSAGKDVKVAEFWVNLSDLEYRNWITDIKFYDLKSNWKPIDREVTIKTKSLETIEIQTYRTECIKSEILSKDGLRETVCTDVKDKVINKVVEVWTPITEVKLSRGLTYIGLFTDVEINERVEWIPKIFNNDVEEWAAWDSSLNNGLRSNYHFDESNGTSGAVDSLGIRNFSGGVGRTTNGKINNATYGDAAGTAKLTYNNLLGNTTALTINTWVKYGASSCPSCSGIVFGGGNTNFWYGDGSCSGAAGTSRMWFNNICTPFKSIADNTWHMVTMTCSDGGTINIYVDGVLNGTSATGCGSMPSAGLAGDFNVNRYALGNENGDELSVWNRTLSFGDIAQLYTDQLANKTYGADESIPVGSIGITLNNPTNYLYTNNTQGVRFNYTITPNDVNITNSTLTFSNQGGSPFSVSLFNNSYALTNETKNFTLNYALTLTEGNYTWNVKGCYINQTFGHNCNFSTSNNTFIIDTTAPRINIVQPTGTYLALTGIPLNYSVIETYPNTCYYYTSDNSTNTSLASCANTTISFSTPGYKSVRVYATDTSGNLNYSVKSFAIDTIQSSYNNFTYETEQESFSISYTNISGVPISASLNYEGTEYLVSANSIGSGSYVSNKTLDIGLTNSTINKSFYWTINYFGGGSATTATFNQTVRPIHLAACNATYTQKTRNYTVYDEETLERIYNHAFYGTFNYWLGSGEFYKTLSIANPYINETTLCISPTDENFIVNGIIQYGDNNLTYTTRNDYLVEATLNNVSQDRDLYLLKNDDSTTFILKVQDFTQTAVAGAYIIIQRYYPGTDTYQTVQVAQTDENGETLGFFKTETVYYSFIINNASGYNLKTTDKQLIFGKTTPYTLIFTVGELIGIPWEEFEDRNGLNTSLVYNNNTKTVGYTYIDANTSFVSSRLYVEKINPSGSPTIICNESSTASSNLLTCDLSAYNESSFKVVGFNTRLISGSNLEVATNVLIIQIDDIIETFGTEGLFWGFIIILTASLTMLYNPIAGLWVMTAATIFVRLIGLAKFGMIWIFGLIFLTIILSILFKPKGGFQ
jgi:hypothetical protein